MIFCGNCGLRLAPGDKQCPRCGTAVESNILAREDAPPDAPTTASPSLLGRMQPQADATRPAGPDTPPHQQKLILRPGQDAGNYDYGTQGAGEATRRVDAPSNPGTSYPGYPQQSGGSYTTQRTPYPDFAPQGNMGYQPYAGQYPQPQATRINAKGRSAALVIILVGLLLILASMTLFILQHNGVFSGTNNGGTVATAPMTPAQQAQAFIQHYYDTINKKDYQTAYNMWQDHPQGASLASYENGFTNTVNDTVAYNNVAVQSNGTVKVPVTVNATEKTAAGGTTNSTYTGYYIVGQQSNGWKILQGVLNKV